jgi:hypothetical protein
MPAKNSKGELLCEGLNNRPPVGLSYLIYIKHWVKPQICPISSIASPPKVRTYVNEGDVAPLWGRKSVGNGAVSRANEA